MPRRCVRWLVVLVLGLASLWIRPAASGHATGLDTANGPVTTLPPAHVLLGGYPQLYQQHRLTCEASAVSMATHGLIEESSIVAAMPLNADPWLGFRGDIDGIAGGLANYGIYATPLAQEMQEFGYQTAVLSGTTALGQLRYTIGVLKVPVVVWVPYRLRKEPTATSTSGGRTFRLVHFEHARLVIGYDAGGIHTLDPLDGPRYDPWSTFLRAWATFDDMGLVIAPPFPWPATPMSTRNVVQGLGAIIPDPRSVPTAAGAVNSASTLAIFPPIAFFTLPPPRVGGTTVITPLRPQDLASPTKPITRVQYSVAAGGLSYKVELFASVLDATTSFAWQLAHPLADVHMLPPSTALPGLHQFTIRGYAVAEVLYHNIEFVVSMPITPGTAAAHSARARTVAMVLVARTSDYAAGTLPANLATLLTPPPYTFIFPDRGIYTVSGIAHTTPGERFYDYAFQPDSLDTATAPVYHVLVEPSATRAISLATAATYAFAGAYQAVGLHPLNLGGTDLANPDLHAWAATVPALHCASWMVFSYRNLWFLLTDSAPPARNTCNAREQETQSLALRLLSTAQAYAQAHLQ